MLLGIDHLVIAVADPDAAATDLEAAVGLAATGGGRHPTGTFNRLVWLGDSYLEFIGVADASLAAQTPIGIAALAALERGGGLATWAVATDAIDGDVAALRAAGARIGEPVAGQRTRLDGRVVRWRVAVPADDLGPLDPPFLIEHDPTAAEWTPAERETRAVEAHPIGGPARLEVLELPVALADLSRVSQRFLRETGLRFRPSLAGRGARDATIGGQTLRLAPAPLGTPPTVRIAAAAEPPGPEVEASVAGVRFVVRRA